ncbi:trigger factor [Solitalea longa]|uniref:Trigger factor n=1 Tax=Solitalea longa TaxID=2079460 RepID=A0A2S5A6R6_9SPHI|nr:trigger factor [Solitalea longa]POY37987.1 trigger factor [Solitalea longa]
MNITQEKINDLSSVVTINIKPEDYKAKVEKAIKEQGKKVRMPGFRPGMVPAAHIKKLYGKSILVDEINNLLSDSLNNYIADNKLEVLGQPLPKVDKDKNYNWDFEDSFEFSYELGLAPEFKAEFSSKDKFKKYKITADAETIKSRTESLQRAYGKMTNPEVSEEGDSLYGDFAQLAEDGSVLEGGIAHTTSLRIELVEDAKIKKSLVGLKKDDVVSFDIQKAYKNNAHQIHNLLNISEEEAEALKGNFQFTVKNVNRLEAAELNEEFFAKVFPDGSVTTAEAFNAYVIEEIEKQMEMNADRKFSNDIYEYALANIKFELPSDFLKRWLKATNEQLSDEELEKDFDSFEKNLKWTLIENKLVQSNNLEIKPEEVVALAKERISAQFAMYSPTPIDDTQLNQYASNFLQDRERATQMYNEVRSNKVFEFLKSTVATEEKVIDYKSFLELK